MYPAVEYTEFKRLAKRFFDLVKDPSCDMDAVSDAESSVVMAFVCRTYWNPHQAHDAQLVLTLVTKASAKLLSMNVVRTASTARDDTLNHTERPQI